MTSSRSNTPGGPPSRRSSRNDDDLDPSLSSGGVIDESASEEAISNIGAETARAAARARINPLRATAFLSGAILLARIIGFVQNIILNALLPATPNAAYRLAFVLPDFINYLVAGGAISVTFIPLFTQLKNDGDERAAWRFFSTVATLMGSVLLALIVITWIFADPLVRLTIPGFDPTNHPDKAKTFALTVQMTRIFLPAQLFFYLGGMLVGVLNAHKRFGASGLTGALYNIVAIFVALGLWMLTQNPLSFAWGILAGAFGGNFLLPLLASRRGPREERLQFRPGLDWNQPGVKRFFRNALPIMMGVSLPVVDQIVVARFSSYLSADQIRDLGSGNRYMVGPLAMLAQAASVAAFPFMASDSAAKKWDKLSDFLRSGLRRLMFLSLPISALLILLARPLMRLTVFGEFDANAADETAVAFAFYCIGIFAWAGQQFVARGFYALQDTLTPTLIGSILTVFFFVPLCWLAANSAHQVLALAFATSVGATAHFTGILIALDKRLSRRRYNAPLHPERVMGTLVRTLAACVPMATAGLFASSLLSLFFGDDASALNKWHETIRIALVTIVALPVFALASNAFRIPEWRWLASKIKHRF